MKNTPPLKKIDAKGVTLIEMTVVILVLLTLISVLYIGAKAYKDAANRSSCILNIRNVQQAVRSDQNLKGIASGSVGLNPVDIFDDTGSKFMVTPKCPSEGIYSFSGSGQYPLVGELAVSCSRELVDSHIPKLYNGW